MTDRCPCCRKPYNETNSRRVCRKCKMQIGSHDKWFFADDGRVEHRHCDNPESYKPKSEEQ